MDLFDIVRAAPPPANIREEPQSAQDDRLPSPVAPSPVAPSPVAPSPIPSNGSCSPIHNKAEGINDPAGAGINTASFLDSDDESHPSHQLPPPKTKAEQKMFVDNLLPSGENSQKVFEIKTCTVRIKRLTEEEIAKHTNPHLAKRQYYSRKSHASDDSDESPPKKQHRTKVHIKMPLSGLFNGGKSSIGRMRPPTPPPRWSKSPKSLNLLKSSKIPRAQFHANESELKRRYGSRFFNCLVRVKRAKLPKSTNARRSRKNNLSVSFSDSVEILGSSRGRKTTKSLESMSVPTRLQRVDATGNVLEDIELTADTLLESPVKGKRGRPPGRGVCNGGAGKGSSTPGKRGKLKRPAQRVPVIGLANLRIANEDLVNDEEDENQEYIVPNEVPECHTADVRRVATSTPTKRSTTTTISDSEVEPEPPLIPSNQNTEKPRKKLHKLNQKEETELLGEKETVEEDKTPPLGESLLDKGDQVNAELKSISAAAESNPEVESENVKSEGQFNVQKLHDNMSDEGKSDTLGEKVSIKDGTPLQEKQADNSDKIVTPSPKVMEPETLDLELAVAAANAAMEEVSSDTLEIRTSLEDVRDLHTPTSRSSSPKRVQRTRTESVESDVSFKSASELTSSVFNGNKLDITSERLPTINDLRTPSIATTTTTNGQQPLSDSSALGTTTTETYNSSAVPPYSPVGQMSSIDGDLGTELGPLENGRFMFTPIS
ncbi:uncharacterized protein LOC115629110 isoform X2 [Scaptodrosophila lebanonensis]|uniref:Uncharacterized protein LOC115629110 isoform X2 n=1 Tax=Drosophila lebanonensis TaxID=7225 RepID=A0A6J2U2D2_DROLE|nr:uncharacterized protein LOC115629110 isoform X2 [Scaptodrosophila lebanonensis]